jgi:hypothetical protein
MKKIYCKIPIPLLFDVMGFSLCKSYSQRPGSHASESMAYSGIITKITTNTDPYRLKYTAINEESGVYFFRIKQVYSNGYIRFSDIKSVALISSGSRKFNFYPNPSNGIVGIKFADNFDGKLFIRIFNMQGQTVVNKGILVRGYRIIKLQRYKRCVLAETDRCDEQIFLCRSTFN